MTPCPSKSLLKKESLPQRGHTEDLFIWQVSQNPPKGGGSCSELPQFVWSLRVLPKASPGVTSLMGGEFLSPLWPWLFSSSTTLVVFWPWLKDLASTFTPERGTLSHVVKNRSNLKKYPDTCKTDAEQWPTEPPCLTVTVCCFCKVSFHLFIKSLAYVHMSLVMNRNCLWLPLVFTIYPGPAYTLKTKTSCHFQEWYILLKSGPVLPLRRLPMSQD